MEWINAKEKLPPYLDEDQDISTYVFVTDGKLIEIGQYIFRPRSYGCAVDDNKEKATCGSEPHWHLEADYVAFRDGDKSFYCIETFEITHWIPLPTPPKCEKGNENVR